MRTSALDVALLATGAVLWIAIFLIVICCGAHMVRQAKQILRNRAAADADAARVAADFALAMGEPAPVPRLSRRRILTRHLLTEAASPPFSSPQPPQGLSLEEIDSTAPCSKSPRGITCSICLDEIDEGAEQRELPCFHRFHPECIRLWVSRVNRCPQCQAEVLSAGKVGITNLQTDEEDAVESLTAARRARAVATFQSLRGCLSASFFTSQETDDNQAHGEQQIQQQQPQE